MVHWFSTVWVYLFFLPFQLLDQFYWYSIFGVAIAAFIYLGFLAAGEEIEQPFGMSCLIHLWSSPPRLFNVD
jgi:ion channel-forming bestrophin family protein